jgi:hypothetical protein
MGLDVYLHKIENQPDVERREEEYNRRSEATWDKICGKGVSYNDIPDDKKEEARAATSKIAKELGLGEYGSADDERETIELPSAKYPDHYFKVGYWRSSYNEGGINNVMRKLIGTDLYDIVQPPEDTYEFQPDWIATKKRATSALGQLKTYLAKLGNYNITKIEQNMFMGEDRYPHDSKAALEAFIKVRDTHQEHADNGNDPFSWFSNGVGEYFLKPPMQLVAAIPGFDEHYSGKTVPVTYLIYKPDDSEDNEGYHWYAKALEIVIETCDYVLTQPDKEKYYLSWSG